VKEETNLRIFGAVPREKAFYFFTSIGNYTGESATSLKEFVEKIKDVNVKSLQFHLYRGDFEKWTLEVLRDEELALEMRKLQRFNLAVDILRSQLYETVSKHLKHLENRMEPI